MSDSTSPQDSPAATSEGSTPSTRTKTFALFPRWWWIFLGAGVGVSFVVSLVENAASQLVLNATVIFAMLLLFFHWFRRGTAGFMLRSAPLFVSLAIIAFCATFVRVDDMSGNLVPTRVSFSWQPQPDELLVLPPQQTPAGGIDLATTTPEDFAEFLGPGRLNAVELQLADDWDANPPKRVWHKEEFGAGWSAFSAVNGFAVTMEQRGPDEIVSCYEIKSGDLVWSHAETARHQTVPGGVGPRSTPTIYNGRVYSLGATGILLCLDGTNGEVIWRRNLLEEIGTTPEEESELVQWGRSASPLLDQGRVIVPLGISKTPEDEYKAGASLLALDALTGDELWRKGKYQVSYASPLVATLGGVRQFIVVCESQICGHDAETGEQLWEQLWTGNSAANASCSQPVVLDETRLFVSKGYAYGAAVLEITRQGEQWQVDEVWRKLTVMKTKFTNVVVYEGHVYGLDDTFLSCVDLESGRRTWRVRGGHGHGQVLRVGDKLLVQAESGEVALVALDPDGYEELASFAPIEGKTWNNPCVYGNLLLVRNGQQAACYELPLE